MNNNNRGRINTVEKRDPFYDYYQREMTYLRERGRLFAQQFPKIARRLDLSSVSSSDPHVERLLESFAFLTANLQRDIDDQFPRMTQSLLRVLYPQFMNPLPPFTIAHFDPKKMGSKMSTAYDVPRGTPLFTRSKENAACRFQTVYPMKVAPVDLEDATIVARDSLGLSAHHLSQGRLLKLTVRSHGGPFQKLNLDHLRFYIMGSETFKHDFYEALLTPQGHAWAENSKGQPQYLGPDVVQPVGFSEDESMFPYPDHAHPGYRLLLEYFFYADKFMFVDIQSHALKTQRDVLTFYLPLSDTIPLRSQDINSRTFSLNCTPVINLFHKISEPLILDRRRVEYPLIPDLKNESTHEVYAIKEILATNNTGKQETTTYRPYFSYRHDAPERQDKTFWHMRREPTTRLPMSGTDVFVSFVDLDLNPIQPAQETIYGKILCTNRSLAVHIAPNTLLFGEEKLPDFHISCIDRPTSPVYPPMDGAVQWKIVSQLSLNHLGLTGEKEALASLKELLRLYGTFDKERVLPEFDMLVGLETQSIVRRFGIEAWRGFAQGTQITMTFEPRDHTDSRGFLLSMVLNHIFPMFTNLNSFTELQIYKTSQERIWKQWKPRSGSRVLL